MRGASAAAMNSALAPPVRSQAGAVFDWGASSPLFLTFPAISPSLLGDRAAREAPSKWVQKWRELSRGWCRSEAVLQFCPFSSAGRLPDLRDFPERLRRGANVPERTAPPAHSRRFDPAVRAMLSRTGSVAVAVVGGVELAPHGLTVFGVVDLEVIAARVVLDLREEPRVGSDAAVVPVLANVEQEDGRDDLTLAPGMDLGADGPVDAVVGQPVADRAGRHVDVQVGGAVGVSGRVAAGVRVRDDLVPAHVDEHVRPVAA